MNPQMAALMAQWQQQQHMGQGQPMHQPQQPQQAAFSPLRYGPPQFTWDRPQLPQQTWQPQPAFTPAARWQGGPPVNTPPSPTMNPAGMGSFVGIDPAGMSQTPQQHPRIINSQIGQLGNPFLPALATSTTPANAPGTPAYNPATANAPPGYTNDPGTPYDSAVTTNRAYWQNGHDR